jgi:hypothetical protein
MGIFIVNLLVRLDGDRLDDCADLGLRGGEIRSGPIRSREFRLVLLSVWHPFALRRALLRCVRQDRVTVQSPGNASD